MCHVICFPQSGKVMFNSCDQVQMKLTQLELNSVRLVTTGTECIGECVRGAECIGEGVRGTECIGEGVRGAECIGECVRGAECIGEGVSVRGEG